MPLNIDWQQILLHWMNLAILIGGLYFLLYEPVKAFMAKRQDEYRRQEEEAAGKLREAEAAKAALQARLEGEEEALRESRAKAQLAMQQSAEEQLAQAQAQARQILTHARAEAEHDREEILRSAQRELRRLAADATRKLALQGDPFEQFLNLAEEAAHDDSEQ